MGLFGTGLAALEQLECTGHDVFMINFYAYGGTLGEIRISIQHDNQRDSAGNVLALRALPWLLLGCIQHTPDMFWHRVKTARVGSIGLTM